MCGRDTENREMENDAELAEYQGKRYVALKIVHKEKYIAFQDIGKDRRKRKFWTGLRLLLL